MREEFDGELDLETEIDWSLLANDPPADVALDRPHFAHGDLARSEVHGYFVRFLRWEGSYAVVADRNTMKELPDYVHHTQMQ